MDTLTKKQRSLCMSKIKSKHTKPEIAVRKILSAEKIKYRLHAKLPGKPDIIIPKIKKAIFINGCFWHKHKCKKWVQPKTNKTYWAKKFQTNTERQKNDTIKLRKVGWKTLILWECEIKNREKVSKKIIKYAKG